MVSHKLEIVSCVVPGCENTSFSCPDKCFFLLSFQEERCQHWLLVCKREDLLGDPSSVNDFAVCSDHFIGDHFEDKARTKLKDNAVPTIFPQETKLNPQIITSEDNLVFIKTEIDYFISDEENDDCEEESCSMENCEAVKDVQHLCRLCAKFTDEVVYLFNTSEENLNLARKINASLPVTVQDTDLLPKQLCSSCVIKVNMCHEFAETCLIAEEKLLLLVNTNAFQSHQLAGDIKTVPDIVTSELGQNFSSITVVEGGSDYKHDKNSNDHISSTSNNIDCFLKSSKSPNRLEETELDSSVLFSCPLCPEGTVSVKNNEPLVKENEILFTDDESIDTFAQDNLKHNVEEKIHPAELDNTPQSINLGMLKSKNSVLKNVSLENARNMPTCNNKEKKENWWNSDSLKMDDCLEKEDGDNSLNSELQECVDTVYCCICQEAFDSLSLCLNHSKNHFSGGHYPCSVCKKYFTSESEHTQHCKLHMVRVKKFSHKGKRLKCDFCERRFNSQRTFFNHSCISSDPKQFRCNTCKKSYSTEERLLFHKKFHEGARMNYCEQCGKEFDNEGTLYYHTRMVHEGERPFSCGVCGKKFYSNSRLIAHKRVHTGERPFGCEVCGRKFYDRDTLKGHYVTHMPVKPFQCDFCGICWGRKSLLNQHIRTHHSDDNSVSRRVPSLIHYYCKICNTNFTNSTDVLMHRTTHWKTSSTNQGLNSNTHVCEYCGESFSLVTMLVKHRKQKHPDEKPYVCSLCSVHSHTLYEARLHRNSHSLNKEEKTEETKVEKSSTFICEACGNIFTEKRRFMRHMREHKANHSYKCQICGKQFIDNQRLTVHTRLHTGEKPYTCNVCGKKFSQTSALYTHALLHTGVKPHSCDLCGKAFRIKADRDNHRRTHTGEKPYKCEFCGKTFRTGQVYYQHRMIHTGERRFPCNICGKAFKRSHTLVVHKRIHTGEKPNICDICGKGFRQRSDMRKHRALHASTT